MICVTCQPAVPIIISNLGVANLHMKKGLAHKPAWELTLYYGFPL